MDGGPTKLRYMPGGSAYLRVTAGVKGMFIGFSSPGSLLIAAFLTS